MMSEVYSKSRMMWCYPVSCYYTLITKNLCCCSVKHHRCSMLLNGYNYFSKYNTKWLIFFPHCWYESSDILMHFAWNHWLLSPQATAFLFDLHGVSRTPHCEIDLNRHHTIKKTELGRMSIPLSPVPLFCKIHFLSKLYIPKHSDPCNASFKMNTVHVYLFAIIDIRWDI